MRPEVVVVSGASRGIGAATVRLLGAKGYRLALLARKGKCLCRKPGSLFFEKAVARFHIDPKQSLMVGDRERDIEAAAAVGIPGVLVNVNSTASSWGISL